MAWDSPVRNDNTYDQYHIQAVSPDSHGFSAQITDWSSLNSGQVDPAKAEAAMAQIASALIAAGFTVYASRTYGYGQQYIP
jgi:hypothetical protein